MSDTVAKGVGRAVDAFGKLKVAINGITFSIAQELAPYIEILSNSATSLLASGGRAKNIGKSVASAIIAGVKFIGDLIQSMVRGVLDFVQQFKGLFISFRSSAAGQALGNSAPPHSRRCVS